MPRQWQAVLVAGAMARAERACGAARGARAALAVAVTLLLCAPTALGAIHRYHGERFLAVGDAFIFRGGREGLVARSNEADLADEEAAATAATARVGRNVGNGNTFIRFSRVHFHRTQQVANEYAAGRVTNGKQNYVGMVQAVVFEVGDRDRIGHVMPDGRTRRFCCTPTLQAQTGCEADRLIVKQREDEPGWPWVTEIFYEDNATVAYAVDDAVVIDTTGMYHLWFVVCDPNLASVSIDGQTTWKNPTGYLPGMMAPNLELFKWMSVAYGVLGVGWFLAYAFHWRNTMMLQHFISAVILLSLVEVTAWYFDFQKFNTSGLRPEGITTFAVLAGASRKSVSRLLVLVVSMGYGVVKPTLGGITQQVVSLTAVYAVATALLDVMTNVGTVDDLDSSLRVILVLPVAALDAVFILWIFTSLSRTLAQLQARRQSAKLAMYRKFTNALALMVLFSIAFIAYEMIFKISDKYNERWQEDWVPTAYWQVLSFALLLVVCVLWGPAANSRMYAYHEDDVAEVWDEADAITENFGEDTGKTIATDVFSLEEEDGNAKLE